MISLATRLRVLALAALACATLGAASPACAQASASDLTIRLDQLENQMRQLTGTIEQLQYRNQQLEQALRRMQEDSEFRFQQLGKGPPASQVRPANAAPLQSPAPVAQPSVPGRRSDAFDPGQNPNAPGVPRTLGSMSGSASLPPPLEPAGNNVVANAGPVNAGPMSVQGAPSGRPIGAPLDLSTLGGTANDQTPSGN